MTANVMVIAERQFVGTDGDTRVGQVLGRAAASKAISAAVMVAHDRGATVTAALLVNGDPAEAADERDADLIVVGARHDVSLAERLLGTVATEVVRRAECEVLIVRPRSDLGDLQVPEG